MNHQAEIKKLLDELEASLLVAKSGLEQAARQTLSRRDLLLLINAVECWESEGLFSWPDDKDCELVGADPFQQEDDAYAMTAQLKAKLNEMLTGP